MKKWGDYINTGLNLISLGVLIFFSYKGCQCVTKKKIPQQIVSDILKDGKEFIEQQFEKQFEKQFKKQFKQQSDLEADYQKDMIKKIGPLMPKDCKRKSGKTIYIDIETPRCEKAYNDLIQKYR